MDRAETLERVLAQYTRWYNITRIEDDPPLAAFAEFHEHGTGYLLIKRAQTWAADRHEYAYFFTMPHLTKELYEQCLARAQELGGARIDPDDGQHMCSYIVAIFLCDSADEDAAAALKKCHIEKSFHFSLKGWMEVHTALIELEKDSVSGNGAGRNTVKFLKNVLHPKVRKRGFLKR